MSSVSISLGVRVLVRGGDSSAAGYFPLSLVGVRDSIPLNVLLVLVMVVVVLVMM